MSHDPAASLRVRLQSALTAARKTRDPLVVAALRSTLGAIDNAEAVAVEDSGVGDAPMGEMGIGVADVARRDLLEDEVVAVVRGEIAERLAAAVEYEQCGQAERAAQLRAEADVLASHLSD